MQKQIKIGNVKLKSNIILAPMAGYTDVAFRSLAASFGAGLTVTEMVSAKALVYESAKTKELLYKESNESPCAVQLFGHDPNDFAFAVKLKELEPFDIIDINMGCPAPKIVKNGDGSALLKDFDLAEKIIKATVSSTKKPVTVKFRIGFDKNHIVAVEFAKMCEKAGASAITIHGRTRDQFYEGLADLDIIEECAKAVTIPVFANGNILTKEDIKKVVAKGKAVAGVALGRSALGRPEIFSEIAGKKLNINKLELIKKHYQILSKYFGQHYVVINMRKQLCFYLKGISGASEIRQQILQLETMDEVFNLLDKLFV